MDVNVAELVVKEQQHERYFPSEVRYFVTNFVSSLN